MHLQQNQAWSLGKHQNSCLFVYLETPSWCFSLSRCSDSSRAGQSRPFSHRTAVSVFLYLPYITYRTGPGKGLLHGCCYRAEPPCQFVSSLILPSFVLHFWARIVLLLA